MFLVGLSFLFLNFGSVSERKGNRLNFHDLVHHDMSALWCCVASHNQRTQINLSHGHTYSHAGLSMRRDRRVDVFQLMFFTRSLVVSSEFVCSCLFFILRSLYDIVRTRSTSVYFFLVFPTKTPTYTDNFLILI